MAVAADDRAVLINVAALLRKGDRDAARERGVALPEEQRIHGRSDGDERRAARGLHGHARAAEGEFVAEARGEVILVAADEERVAVGLELRDEIGEHGAVRADVVEEVGVEARAGENADAAGVARGVEAGVFERVPRAFEDSFLLR